MREAQHGDERAYAELLTLLAPIVARHARRKVGHVPWVDDVVQETLLTVHRSRHTYDPDRPFAPWFYAIAGSRLIDVLRRERRVTSREVGAEDLSDVGDRGAEGTWGAEARSALDVDAIRAAVDALPARQRDAIDALKYRGESVGAASRRLGMTEPAVKIAAHRGYKTLRRLLGRRDED